MGEPGEIVFVSMAVTHGQPPPVPVLEGVGDPLKG